MVEEEEGMVVDTEEDMVEAVEVMVEDTVDTGGDMDMAKRREKPMPNQKPMLLLKPMLITDMEVMVVVMEATVVAMEDMDMVVNADPLNLDMDMGAMVDTDTVAMVDMDMVDTVITDKLLKNVYQITNIRLN